MVKFNSMRHTVSYLLANPAIAKELCVSSKAFARSDVARDSMFLTFVSPNPADCPDKASMAHRISVQPTMFQHLLSSVELSLLTDRHGTAVEDKIFPTLEGRSAVKKSDIAALCDAGTFNEFRDLAASLIKSINSENRELFDYFGKGVQARLLGVTDYIIFLAYTDQLGDAKFVFGEITDPIKRWKYSKLVLRNPVSRQLFETLDILYSRPLLIFSRDEALSIAKFKRSSYKAPALSVITKDFLINLLDNGLSLRETLRWSSLDFIDMDNPTFDKSYKTNGGALIDHVVSVAPKQLALQDELSKVNFLISPESIQLVIHFDNVLYIHSLREALMIQFAPGYSLGEYDQYTEQVKQTFYKAYMDSNDDVREFIDHACSVSSLTGIAELAAKVKVSDVICSLNEATEENDPEGQTMTMSSPTVY